MKSWHSWLGSRRFYIAAASAHLAYASKRCRWSNKDDVGAVMRDERWRDTAAAAAAAADGDVTGKSPARTGSSLPFGADGQWPVSCSETLLSKCWALLKPALKIGRRLQGYVCSEWTMHHKMVNDVLLTNITRAHHRITYFVVRWWDRRWLVSCSVRGSTRRLRLWLQLLLLHGRSERGEVNRWQTASSPTTCECVCAQSVGRLSRFVVVVILVVRIPSTSSHSDRGTELDAPDQPLNQSPPSAAPRILKHRSPSIAAGRRAGRGPCAPPDGRTVSAPLRTYVSCDWLLATPISLAPGSVPRVRSIYSIAQTTKSHE